MNKIRATLLAIATIIAVPGTYFYKPFEIDYIKIGVGVAVALISILTYLKIRKNTKSKAAAAAVRRSAGASGVKKLDLKLFSGGLSFMAIVLISSKGYLFLIPVAIAGLSVLLCKLYNKKFLLPIGYMATIFAGIGFIFPYIAASTSPFVTLLEGVFILFSMLMILPLADLFTMEG